ncbi:MAG: 30S ribosomal protein S6 [Rhodospirillaceae bacterium TMED167]|nr:30S ribosomal protein S6 [Rhodospirillaceae bacterium]OUW25818.1 MAG: 30S ribosomal protein S6 [Rhodospirillaceae bacterium TMED167]
MPYYESVYIARQEISAQQVDALTDGFEDVIKQAGGSITKRENWGLKSLAYRIKKSRKAHYTLMNIDAPAGAVHEMERQMRLNDDVLRYLTLRLDELDEDPSIQAQNKSNRSYDNGTGGEFRARPSDKPEGRPEKEDAGDNQPSANAEETAVAKEAQTSDEGEEK